MKAAVVQSFNSPPALQAFREPEAGPGETVIAVRATALTPIVRALAAGRHYAGGAATGFVPGVDGVGLTENGQRVYFLFPKAPFGSMAERSLAATAMTVPVPDALGDADAAALVPGGLASWIALSRRAPIQPGATVMVVGATGASGGMALQTARHFGAGKVIAVGRHAGRLAELQADVRIPLDAGADTALRQQFDQGVDVVLDFVWGAPAGRVLQAATRDRGSRQGEPRLRYVQLGTIAGDELPLRGDMFRSTGLELIGSGIGSVSIQALVEGAGELLAAAPAAKFRAPFRTVPLDQVAEAWAAGPEVRQVIVPGSP